MVTYKTRPQLAARDQLAQIRHHLATVAHAQRQRSRTMERRFRIRRAPGWLNRMDFAQPLTRPQHVAVGKVPPQSHQRMEAAHRYDRPAGRSYGRQSRQKPARWKRRRHLHVRVHPARAVQRFFGRACRNVRRGDIFINIKRQLHVEARIGIIRFLARVPGQHIADWSRRRCIRRRFRPPDTQRRLSLTNVWSLAVITKRSPAVASTARSGRSQQGQPANSASTASLSSVRTRNHAASSFLVEQCSQMVIAQRGDIDPHAAVAGKGHSASVTSRPPSERSCQSQ